MGNQPPHIRSWILTALCMVLADTVQANPVDLRAQEFERRTREQLEREQRLRLLERDEPSQPTRPVPTPQTQPQTGEACWQVRGLQLSGNTLLPQAQLRAQVQAQLTDCMGAGQINQLLAALTALYVDAGYIASRPYLARAPEAGQPLEIVIEQGFVESIELADPSLPVSLRGAFPGMLGQPLQLRDLEQGLDQLNRLRSLDLSVDVLPGSLPGGSRLLVRPRAYAPRLGATASYNNRGAEITGRHTGLLNVTYDSPLGLNDFIAFSASTSLDQATTYSRSQGVFYTLPYGFWTLSLSASQAQYRYGIELPGQTYTANGQSYQYGIGLNRLLWRDQSTLLNAGLRLNSKGSQSYFADTYLAIQSPRLTVAEASLNLLKIADGTWSTTLTYAQGLDWLGADRDQRGAPAGLPRAQFRKYRADVDYWRQGQDGHWQWHSQLALQYSPDPLPSLEQLLVTDYYAVRGLRQASLAAANGAVWRNTLSLPYSYDGQWHLSPRLGLDLGWSQFARGANRQRVGGVSLGAGLSQRHWQLDLDYQRGLFGPNLPGNGRGFWLMALSLRL